MTTIPTPRTTDARGPAPAYREDCAAREAQYLAAPELAAALAHVMPEPTPEVGRGLTWQITQGADTLLGAIFLASIVIAGLVACFGIIFALVMGAFGIYP